MKLKTYMLGISFLLAYCFIFTPAAFANSVSTSIEIGFQTGNRRGEGRHNRQRSYYKHRRNYPSSFFYYKKFYSYPQKRYYYYYDLYPEQRYYYEQEKEVYPVNPEYLPITSIANMGSQGLPDDVIIEEIKRTRSVYKLTSEVITYLKHNNVGDRVIDFMIETGRKR